MELLIAAVTGSGFAVAAVTPRAIATEPTLTVDFEPAINGDDLVAHDQ